jgi:Ubiquitin-2 like Rad60 SUMO-like
MKKTTKISQLFEAYAWATGVSICCLRFYLDGEQLDPTQTPLMLELEEGQTINVYHGQLGC